MTAMMSAPYFDSALVGKLFRHWRHGTTAGCTPFAEVHLIEAAERVGRIIAKATKAPRQ